MTGSQVREARRLLGISSTRLNALCGFPESVVQKFELTGRIPQQLPDDLQIDRVALLQATLQAAGVEFIEPSAGDLGVRLQISEPT